MLESLMQSVPMLGKAYKTYSKARPKKFSKNLTLSRMALTGISAAMRNAPKKLRRTYM